MGRRQDIAFYISAVYTRNRQMEEPAMHFTFSPLSNNYYSCNQTGTRIKAGALKRIRMALATARNEAQAKAILLARVQQLPHAKKRHRSRFRIK